MSTILDRIATTIGNPPETIDPAHATYWLEDGVIELSMLIPEHEAYRYTKQVEVKDSEGLDLRKHRLFYPHKDGFRAVLIPSIYKNRIDRGLHRATKNFPKAYVDNGKLYVKPEGGHADVLGISGIHDIQEDTEINLPYQLKTAALEYVAARYWSYLVSKTAADFELGKFPEKEDLKDPEFETGEVSDERDIDKPDAQSPELGMDKQYTKIDEGLSSSEYDHSRNRADDDDIEMMQGELAKLRVRLENYQAQMTDEVNRIQALAREYDAKVQHSLQNEQLRVNVDGQMAQLNSNAEQFNATKKLEADISQYQSMLSRFQSLSQNVSSKSQVAMQEFAERVKTYLNSMAIHQQRYQQHVQAYLASVMVQREPSPRREEQEDE